MVVDTVGKPHLFQILNHLLPLLVVGVALVVGIDAFEGAADSKVVLEVLVEHNVAATLSGLAQIVNHQLLLQRQSVKFGNLIANHLHVIEAVDNPLEIAFGLLLLRARRKD